MRNLLFFILANTFVGCVGFNKQFTLPVTLREGLYAGEEKHFLYPSLLVYVQIGKNANIEIYQPMKGEIFTVLKEELLPVKGGGNTAFSGKETAIVWRGNDWCLTQIKKKKWPDPSFKDIAIRFNPAKEKELDVFRNRAYMFDDFRATNETHFVIGFEAKLYDYHVKDLAQTFPHNEFIVEYQKIRTKIMNELGVK